MRNDNRVFRRCTFNALFCAERIFGFVNDTAFRSRRLEEENYYANFFARDAQRSLCSRLYYGYSLRLEIVFLPNSMIGSTYATQVLVP